MKLNNPRAIAALHKFILDSKVYKLAEDYYLVNKQSLLSNLERMVRIAIILVMQKKKLHGTQNYSKNL